MSSDIIASEWARRSRLMDLPLGAGPLPPPARPPFRTEQERPTGGVFAYVTWNVGNWLARRRLKALLELDDHLLKDVGLDRDEIEWALSLPLRTHAVETLKHRLKTRRGRERWVAWFKLAAREGQSETPITGSDDEPFDAALCANGR